MNATIAKLWSETALLLWPQRLILASFAADDWPGIADAIAPCLGGFSAIVVERDEVSVTLEGAAWEGLDLVAAAVAVAGPYRAITFDLPVDLGVCGYLLPAAERLAAAGVSIVPQCGYQKDHILVREADATKAMEVLGGLIEEAKVLVQSTDSVTR